MQCKLWRVLRDTAVNSCFAMSRVGAVPDSRMRRRCGECGEGGFQIFNVREPQSLGRHCERSEAIQLSSLRQESWIASSLSLLAMKRGKKRRVIQQPLSDLAVGIPRLRIRLCNQRREAVLECIVTVPIARRP